MAKAAIVYWSGTGNTEAMANYVAEGAKAAGADVDLYTAADFSADKVAEYSAFAFGCPAMGAEELESDEFEPMWDSVKDSLDGKTVVLFGSYDWGEGDWMETWKSEAPCEIAETLICNNTPDDSDADNCKALGAKLA